MTQHTMTETQRAIGEWCAETFKETNPQRFGLHIAEEVSELLEVTSNPHPSNGFVNKYLVAEELADLAILIFALADHVHISLAEAVNWKHAINRRRSWINSPSHGYDKKTEQEHKTYGAAFAAWDRCLPGESHEFSRREIASDANGWIAGMVYEPCRKCGACYFVSDDCEHIHGSMMHNENRDAYYRICTKCGAILYLDDVDQANATEHAPIAAIKAPPRDEPTIHALDATNDYASDLRAFSAFVSDSLVPLFIDALRESSERLKDFADSSAVSRDTDTPRGAVMLACHFCSSPNLVMPDQWQHNPRCRDCGVFLRSVEYVSRSRDEEGV
jgi:NTP pyrophosphatase (non-canonical NTP hydrolase)